MNTFILLVEDDTNLGFVIKDTLIHKGYEVVLCTNGEQGERAFDQYSFDICIFDVMLPRKDGLSLTQCVRRSNKEIPILLITAKSMLDDKLAGFHAGADDYILKPFSMEELCLRIEVFLRRSSASIDNLDFSIGEFKFHSKNFVLFHPSGQKTLTQKEAEVLQLLCLHKDRVLRREEILNKVWGDDDYFMGRSLDVFISKLRKYLKADSTIQIVNYHGVGFRLEQTTTPDFQGVFAS